jgi:transcriptional regulator with XRE-family HTH domain
VAASEVISGAERLRRIQQRTGLTCEQLGEVFGASKYSVHKLMSGRMRWAPLRLVILEALATALARATPVEVWGPVAGVTPLQRLARIFQLAGLGSANVSTDAPVQLRARRQEAP